MMDPRFDSRSRPTRYKTDILKKPATNFLLMGSIFGDEFFVSSFRSASGGAVLHISKLSRVRVQFEGSSNQKL